MADIKWTLEQADSHNASFRGTEGTFIVARWSDQTDAQWDNAVRLIAFAPEMLAELKRWREQYRRLDDFDPAFDAIVKDVDGLIAKIESP